MSDKIAFITGGNRGIGFQTALELHAAGVKVVISSRDIDEGKEAVANLRAQGAEAAVLRFDVTNAADHQAAYEYFDSNFGRLDILINNAALAKGSYPGSGPGVSASQVPQDVLHSIFETNFFSVVALTNTLLPLIRLRSTPIPAPPSTTPSTSPTMPQSPPSTPTRFTSPGSSATPLSRSTQHTPDGSRPRWVVPAQSWSSPMARRPAPPSRCSPPTAPPAATSTWANASHGKTECKSTAGRTIGISI